MIKSKTNYNIHKGNNNLNIFKTNEPNNNNIFRIHQPFVTSVNAKNIQTNEEESKKIPSNYISKKNNLVSFGKSLNQILINNINEDIMKKGNIIRMRKRKNFSANLYNHNIKNFNNYDIHMKIFDEKLIQMYEDFLKKQKKHKKQKLKFFLSEFEERRQKVLSRIPLSIKRYKKLKLI